MWQNGSMVTARDVEFTINAIKEADSIYKPNVEKIEKIDIIDNKTIKFELTEEISFFEYLLCFPIVKENTYNTENIGTGSYKVEEVNSKEIVLRNDKQKVTVRIYDTVAEMYSDFTKEKLDYLITKNHAYEENIRNIGISEQSIIGRNYYYLVFNNKLEKKVKNQIKNLINREQIIYKLYNNKYKVATFPLEYGSYLNNYMEEVNTENAQIPKSLSLGIKNDEELYKIAEEIKNQFAEKNIEIKLRIL